MNMREALIAALRKDPDSMPKLSDYIRGRTESSEGKMNTVVQAAEALEPILADSVRKRPSRLGRLGLKTSHLLATLAAEDAGSNRRLARIARNSSVGIVFVDIAGFMGYTESHGDEAAAQLLVAFESRVLTLIRRSQGELVKKLGDGFLLAFPSASQAVRGAVALRDTIESRAGRAAPDDAIHVRISVHAGEPLVEQDDLLGHDVNLTARLLDHCAVGEVVVSEAAAELARKRLRSVVFTDRRAVKIRGLAGQVVVTSARRAPQRSSTS